MNIPALLTAIQRMSTYTGQIVHLHEEAPRGAHYASPQQPLLLPVETYLANQGIGALYSHQAQAVEAARAGDNVILTTGTASGKSLAFLLPLLERLLTDPGATALLLYPTKALCQDQFARVQSALTSVGLTDVLAGVLDGDTPAPERRRLRDRGRVILTNPDLLHAGILPQHPRWAHYFARLSLVVLDEIHVYAGIFGANMGNLLRRLDRVCAHYGARPQYVAASATLANPGELAERLTGRAFTAITEDGSPRGARTSVLWNPPVIRATRVRSRRSANVEAHELMALLMEHGIRTITFSKAKMTAEMIARYVEERLRHSAPHLMQMITPYRGGLLPHERRAIEGRLFSGELLGVSSTRALELGIDVGGLQASIMVGYPGTLAAFQQQGGRAGRGTEDALIILVGLDTPANQYVLAHPDYLFDRPLEESVVEPTNPFVLLGHLRCAAHELALPDGEVARFGPQAGLVLEVLESNQKVKHLGDRWYHAATEIPQHEISLRSYSEATVLIQDVQSGRTIGELDERDAPPLLHPEAIYLHGGDSYRVLSLDLARNLALVTREETDYYTQPIGGTDIHHIDHCLREKPFGHGLAAWGEVTAIFTTYGYEKVRYYELDALSRHGVELPAMVLETMALWLIPDESILQGVVQAGRDPMSGLRGIGYATRMLLPLFVTCETLDFSHTVGAINAPWQTIFIYERYPRGLGFTERAYARLHEILPRVREAIRACPCADGCPCCVGKPLRGETVWNVERGEGAIPCKVAALQILDGMLGDEQTLDAPDRLTLSDDPAALRIRLERELRRRLERHREPVVPHPIEPHVPLAYPVPEEPATLATPDVERRGDSRRAFNKALRAKLAERTSSMAEEGAPPPPPPSPPTLPSTPDVPVRFQGDALAARARRLKRGRDQGAAEGKESG
jgi:DEAD/DEAH box helicase domain-containing protein